MQFTPDEMIKIQDYMRRTFGNEKIGVKPRAQAPDSIEILINGEYVGICDKIVEEGETSYNINISILDIDLEG